MATFTPLKSTTKGTRHRAQIFLGKRADGSKRFLYATFGTLKQAKAWAREQETLHARGTLVEGKVTIGVLLDDLKDYYQQQRKGWWAPMLIEKHLRPFFGTLPADQITTSEINRYIRQRQGKVKDTTIGNELAVLHRAFALGMRHDPPKVHRIPHIPRFKPSEPRQGIFEDHEYSALLRELPEEIKPILIYAYFTGSRKGEILGLLWSEVDLDAALAWLPGSKTKNKKPRTIPLAPDVVEALRMQKAVRDRYWPTCRFVFFRHGTGTQVKDFRTAWELACKRAGLWNEETQKPTHLVHDLRRTAVSNLVDSGVPEHTVMAISGHLTRSVFDRYDIVKKRRLTDAVQRLDAYIREKRLTNGLQNSEEQSSQGTETPSKLLN